MNAVDLGLALFERRRPALTEQQVRLRRTCIEYQEWRTLVFDGLTEVLVNDGLTQAEHAAAAELIDSGFFGPSTDGLRELLAAAKSVDAA
ncbi:hypothetical protein [Mycolicibacterium brumae]|uniref:Uncharacterized protein n=1 Tax=Mycolicibacterium brumae TaxID=85968 RepID=A0A2G5P5J9_9MYCO|nr:hypothetical protein [Mycolicibacterium brumae]MCV7191537.1 hypothetical protein [Mycolicibacterium brumae]PIB73638.1 hypothetical protein CQY22_015970 [Mycolicibacterium brumae]RWA16252.1 hypothetical protein MBRU_09080 [Mycolicibacterium brumae DSM 44177]UWW09355.1 hypothetical protein L2Z93_002451 [Mycolicibacterium brumae]